MSSRFRACPLFLSLAATAVRSPSTIRDATPITGPINAIMSVGEPGNGIEVMPAA